GDARHQHGRGPARGRAERRLPREAPLGRDLRGPLGPPERRGGRRARDPADQRLLAVALPAEPPVMASRVALLIGLFVAPAVLLWLGQRLRDAGATRRGAFRSAERRVG